MHLCPDFVHIKTVSSKLQICHFSYFFLQISNLVGILVLKSVVPL